MKSLNTQLTTRFDSLFGTCRTSNIDGSNLLETTLRYISVLTAGEKVFESDYKHLYYRERNYNWLSTNYIAHENCMIVITGCDDSAWRDDSSLKKCLVDSPDFVELNDNFCPVNQFLSSKPQFSRVFVNNTRKTAVITTSSSSPSTRWFVKMLSILPKILQWLFTTEELRTDKYFKSLLDENCDEIVKVVDEICSNFDLRKIQLTKLLSGYEGCYLREQILHLKESNEGLYRNIKNYEETIAQYLQEKSINDIKINSLQNALSNEEKDVVLNFFIQRPCLQIIKRSHSALYYSIVETLEFYDEEEYARSMPNHISVLPNNCQDNYKKLLDSIFVDRKGVFRVKSDFVFTYPAKLVAKQKGEIEGSQYNDVLPHPHLTTYACLGGNKNEINKYLEEGNWDMAIDQTIGATKNINFGDAVVVAKFLKFLKDNPTTKMIEYGDQYLSPSEYYEIVFGGKLDEQEN